MQEQAPSTPPASCLETEPCPTTALSLSLIRLHHALLAMATQMIDTASAPALDVHHLPCAVEHEGPAEVSRYFNPTIKATGTHVDWQKEQRGPVGGGRTGRSWHQLLTQTRVQLREPLS